MLTHYQILGISEDATADEIKSAFKKQALKFHPDRNSSADAESRFKEAAEAYEVLSDAQKKQRYDQFGHAGLSGAGVHDFSHMRPTPWASSTERKNRFSARS